MPRPSPERITNTLTVVRNGRNLPSNIQLPNQVNIYERSWVGTNSAGYPRRKVYNNLNVLSSKMTNSGSINLYRRFPPSNYYWDTVVGPYIFGASSQAQTAPSGSPNANFRDVSHNPVVIQNAINGAMDKIADQKLNLAQFIAERKQVANMVNDTVQKVTKVIGYLRKRKFRKALDVLGITHHPGKFTKDLGNNWLALQYGWKPLLADAHGAAEHLAKNHMGRPLHLIVRKNSLMASKDFSASSTLVDGGGTYIGPVDWVFSERVTRSMCKLEFVVTNDFIRQGRELGLTDPLTLAWELMPWSFVYDWFLPVGDFLQRLSYDSGLVYIGGCSSTKSFQKVSARLRSGTYSYAGGGLSTVSGDALVCENHRFTRLIYPSPPRAVWPDFKDPFSATHVANALALLRGTIRVR